MTLGRLIELYKAEQEGKPIIMRTTRFTRGDDEIHDEKIKLSECSLDKFVSGGYGVSYDFFIKEDE